MHINLGCFNASKKDIGIIFSKLKCTLYLHLFLFILCNYFINDFAHCVTSHKICIHPFDVEVCI